MGELINIRISENENSFIDLIKAFQADGDTCPSRKPVRFVGGWVRDRLMGIESHDIDVVLEDCTGNSFVASFEKWIYEKKCFTKGVKCMIVKANAEKSKHLETAIMRFPELDLCVDFVNFRTESYDQSSRIPKKLEFGDAYEDSLRRDLTINALYFNINTQEIEDWTGKGMSDLENGILRTPRSPEQTFLDDPLRILRIIRFTAKLSKRRTDGQDFTIHPTIEDVINSQPKIRSALAQKVSKERIREEIATMFTYPNINQALWHLMKWHLLGVILNPLTDHLSDHDEPSHREVLKLTPLEERAKIGLLLEEVMNVLRADGSDEYFTDLTMKNPEGYFTYEQRGVIVLSAILSEYHRVQWLPNGTSAAEQALINLKSKHVSAQVKALLNLAFALQQTDMADRSQVTKILRMSSAAKWWEAALVVACVLNRFDVEESLTGPHHYERHDLIKAIIDDITEWRRMIISEHQLKDLWDIKPVVSGHEIISLLKDMDQPYKPQTVGELMSIQLDYLALHWNPDPTARSNMAPQIKEYIKNYFLSPK